MRQSHYHNVSARQLLACNFCQPAVLTSTNLCPRPRWGRIFFSDFPSDFSVILKGPLHDCWNCGGESLNYFYGIGGDIHTNLTSFFIEKDIFCQATLVTVLIVHSGYTKNTKFSKSSLFLSIAGDTYTKLVSSFLIVVWLAFSFSCIDIVVVILRH